jgi:hypothetical protein
MPNTQHVTKLIITASQAAGRLGLPKGMVVEAYPSPAPIRQDGDRWIIASPEAVSGSWIADKDVQVFLPEFMGRSVLQILHLHRITFADLLRLPVEVASREIQRLDDAAETGLVHAVRTGSFRNKAG